MTKNFELIVAIPDNDKNMTYSCISEETSIELKIVRILHFNAMKGWNLIKSYFIFKQKLGPNFKTIYKYCSRRHVFLKRFKFFKAYEI